MDSFLSILIPHKIPISPAKTKGRLYELIFIDSYSQYQADKIHPYYRKIITTNFSAHN